MSRQPLPDFGPFRDSIHKKWLDISTKELFRTDVSGDELWDLYLNSFPEGTNPIFRKRQLHDGSYDRQFIRQLGTLVSLNEKGEHVSVWDATNLEYPYDVVASKLSRRMRSADILGVWRTSVGKYSQEESVEAGDFGEGKNFRTWIHLYGEVAVRHKSTSPEADAGKINSRVAVYRRGLETISVDALETIAELISNGSLYRGPEFIDRIAMFLTRKRLYDKMSDGRKEYHVWNTLSKDDFRNTVIGTLAVDISEGRDLEYAVKAFEGKVAPTNYKRPKPVVTKAMVNSAMNTVEKLGISESLQRRHAALSDITINDVLWVSSSVSGDLGQASDTIRDILMKNVPQKPRHGNDITFDQFREEVLPTAERIELHLSGAHTNRLMSLTTSVNSDAPPLFKWNNNLAWTYTGDVTDSLKERVKASGGNVNCFLRVSLGWYNGDDLDIHCVGPLGHIYFTNRIGVLDVDMNAQGRVNDQNPVENLAFGVMPDGEYLIFVHNFRKRDTRDPGFMVEIDNKGDVRQYYYHGVVNDDSRVNVMSISVEGNQVKAVTVSSELDESPEPKEVWGLTTETFVPVNAIVNSPNHWDGQTIGNKHTFFILEGCKNPDTVRGIYNEYLRNDLAEHGKVFELLGNKTKAPYSEDQLSGIGMTETNKQPLTLRVNGDTIYRVSV